MDPRLTGVQSNEAHRHTDDFITRTYILPLLRDAETRARLVEEHRENPIGRAPSGGSPAQQHSDDLARVLDKFRRAGMAGKYVRICVRPHEDYKIGVVSGVRGAPVKILKKSYPSEEACEHAIFLRRIDDLLAAYDGQ